MELRLCLFAAEKMWENEMHGEREKERERERRREKEYSFLSFVKRAELGGWGSGGWEWSCGGGGFCRWETHRLHNSQRTISPWQEGENCFRSLGTGPSLWSNAPPYLLINIYYWLQFRFNHSPGCCVSSHLNFSPRSTKQQNSGLRCQLIGI